jgi:hypothetical protein
MEAINKEQTEIIPTYMYNIISIVYSTADPFTNNNFRVRIIASLAVFAAAIHCCN